MRDLAVLVLAAGKGTRMPDDQPKMLRPLVGRPLLEYVLRSARALAPARIVLVLGHRADEVRRAMSGDDLEVVLQTEQRGTADAVLCAEPALRGFSGDLLILYGDVPLLRPLTLEALLETHAAEENGGTILTATLDDATGYGRIVRDAKGRMSAIREQADLRNGEDQIREMNSGIMVFRCLSLFSALRKITPDNRQGEYYLTDAVGILRDAGSRVGTCHLEDPAEVLGVNTLEQLREVERILTRRLRSDSPDCARCAVGLEINAETGLLAASEHACLAVERHGFNSGQLVIFPRRHITSLLSLLPEETGAIGGFLRLGEGILQKVYHFDGLNIGVSSGAGKHLAIQIIPRWSGDLNFLPLVAGLKPIPEDPRGAWTRLREVMP